MLEGKLTHSSSIRALCDVLVCAFLRRVGDVHSFAEIHQVQGVELVNSQFSCELVCHISNYIVEGVYEFVFDCIGDVVCDA